MDANMVQAELIKELNEEIQGLRIELTREKLDKRRIRRERDRAIGQVRLMNQDREYEVR